ncbi:hypothetical protein [Nocardioides lijunqiniae]|uniref:hypothetical protein n=1 Tax=Nocardioides lijunqiniae TaxID=2760832 RepID=UPI0018784897|nr:hypothetical protein [Nocardioides lijunqiniae]
MENLAVLMARLHAALAVSRRRDERGDVPEWVLVTVMSAGIVVVIWGVAEGALSQMLRDALNSVK